MGKRKRRLRKQFKIFLIIVSILALLGITYVFLNNTIVLLGDKEVTIEVFSDYEDAGAYHKFDADLSGYDYVNPNKVGDYKVTFNWLIFSKSRIVHVVDSVAPEFTFKHLYDEIHYLNSNYNTEGSYRCVDNYDGDITDKVKVDGYDKIDPSKPGVNIVTYTATDSSGNTTTIKKTITFVNDDFNYLTSLDNKANVAEEMLKPVIDWFNLYFKAMRYVEYVDSANLFASSAKDYACLNNYALQMLIDTRNYQDHSMALDDCGYSLTISKLTKNQDSTYTIKVIEDQYLKFMFLNGTTSECRNIINYFTVKKVGNEYKLVIVNKPESFIQTFLRDYKKTNDYTAYFDNIYRKYMDKYTVKMKQYLQDKDKLNSGEVTYQSLVTKIASFPYDRQAALAYVDKYCLSRNKQYWDLPETNCQNFASQTLVASGIPMDYTGSQQWKYYGVNENTKDEQAGRSKSFVSIIYFLKYIQAEKTEGLVTEQFLSLYYGEVGDLVYYQDLRDRYHHVVVVVDVIKDDNGNVIDLLVSGNTTDMSYYPVSAATYFNRDVVKIIGYNKG